MSSTSLFQIPCTLDGINPPLTCGPIGKGKYTQGKRNNIHAYRLSLNCIIKLTLLVSSLDNSEAAGEVARIRKHFNREVDMSKVKLIDTKEQALKKASHYFKTKVLQGLKPLLITSSTQFEVIANVDDPYAFNIWDQGIREFFVFRNQ